MTSINDVMGCLRRMYLSKMKTFGELSANFLHTTYVLCSKYYHIDFVFDTYMDGSVKDSERTRRCSCSPINLNEVNAETQLPVIMDNFWASATNKDNYKGYFEAIS